MLPLSPLPPAPEPIPPPPPPPPPPAEPLLSDREFYDRYANAVVQIFCHTTDRIVTATGIMLNQRGLILTNAHVAKLVIEAAPPNCQARHGNPASDFAGISIIYPGNTTLKISDTDVPQEDFAFLELDAPREAFSFVPIDLGTAPVGEAFLTLGYPSEFLQSVNTAFHSNLVFSSLVLGGYADLDANPDDAEGYVFHGGIILQQGSSGTPIFYRNGRLNAIIFATTKGPSTDSRDGIAIKLSSIDRALRAETGQGLEEYISTH